MRKYKNGPIQEGESQHSLSTGEIAFIEVMEEVRLDAPSTYIFPMNMFHQIIDESTVQPSMTIMITAPSESPFSILQAPSEKNHATEQVKQVVRIPKEEIINRLSQVVRFLTGEISHLVLPKGEREDASC